MRRISSVMVVLTMVCAVAGAPVRSIWAAEQPLQVGHSLFAAPRSFSLAAKTAAAPQSKSAREVKAVDDGSVIDVMILYTDGMAGAHPGGQIHTRMQYLIDLANVSYNNNRPRASKDQGGRKPCSRS